MARSIDARAIPPHNGCVEFAFLMAQLSSSIYHTPSGLTAFTPSSRLAMIGGTSTVNVSLSVEKAQQWATTLEAICLADPMAPHAAMLRTLQWWLETALTVHQRDHEEVITAAPSYEDMVAYLAAYLHGQETVPVQAASELPAVVS